MILVKRIKDDGEATIGELYIDGELFCFTLEDQFQEIKVAGETRIPAGTYKLKAIHHSGLAVKYRKRFGHDFVIGIEDVPGFSHIRIHCGNTDKHTDGCLLVGMVNNGNGTIGQSAVAYKKLFDIVKDQVAADKAYITILDEE